MYTHIMLNYSLECTFSLVNNEVLVMQHFKPDKLLRTSHFLWKIKKKKKVFTCLLSVRSLVKEISSKFKLINV